MGERVHVRVERAAGEMHLAFDRQGEGRRPFAAAELLLVDAVLKAARGGDGEFAAVGHRRQSDQRGAIESVDHAGSNRRHLGGAVASHHEIALLVGDGDPAWQQLPRLTVFFDDDFQLAVTEHLGGRTRIEAQVANPDVVRALTALVGDGDLVFSRLDGVRRHRPSEPRALFILAQRAELLAVDGENPAPLHVALAQPKGGGLLVGLVRLERDLQGIALRFGRHVEPFAGVAAAAQMVHFRVDHPFGGEGR